MSQKTNHRKTNKSRTQKTSSKTQKVGYKKTQTAGSKYEKRQSEVVAFFMEMLTTIKLYHWKTRSFAQHKATDELHERVEEHVDKFVEVMLGKKKDDRVKMIQKCLRIFDFSKKSDFRDQLIEYREFLIRMSQFLDKERDTDLLNIRDEIVGDINQFLYLLSFDK
jgi:DNA-binding ferritin-like protein